MADQYWSNVVLAMPMDGANGSTTFTDISPTPKAVTRYGNAQISTAQSKFGGESAYFDGDGGYLTVPASTDLNLTAVDFTIDGWFYCTTLTASSQSIINKDGVAAKSYPQYDININSTGKLGAFLGNGTGINPTGTSYTGTTTITLNAWHYFALVKDGSSVRLYLNGAVEASGTAPAMYDGGKPLLVGYQTGQASSAYFRGYIDDLRITKGVARYTANFTPPTVSYLADAIGYGSVATLIDQVASTGGTSIIGVAGIIPSQEIIGGAGEVLVALGTADISPPLHQAEATGTVPVVGLGDFSPPIEQANAAGTIPVTGQGSIVPSLDAVAAVSAGITATGEIIPSLDNVASAGTSAVVRAATVEQKKPVVGSTGSTSIISYGAVRTKDCKLDGAGRSNEWRGSVEVAPGVEVVWSSGTVPILGRGEIHLKAGKGDSVESIGRSNEWRGSVEVAPGVEVVWSSGTVPILGRGEIHLKAGKGDSVESIGRSNEWRGSGDVVQESAGVASAGRNSIVGRAAVLMDPSGLEAVGTPPIIGLGRLGDRNTVIHVAGTGAIMGHAATDGVYAAVCSHGMMGATGQGMLRDKPSSLTLRGTASIKGFAAIMSQRDRLSGRRYDKANVSYLSFGRGTIASGVTTPAPDINPIHFTR